MSDWIDAYLGVGSNLGDRRATIHAAIELLHAHEAIEVVRQSHLQETEPVGQVLQPKFLNGAIHVRTVLSPRALLKECLGVEAQFGRRRVEGESGGPRTLDLDVLLYGSVVMDEPGLCVPHPRLHERLFVLEPLAEVAGDVWHPVLCRSVQELLEQQRITAAAS